MGERPECQNEGCVEGALVQAYGKLMCGTCFMKIQNKINNSALELLKD